MTLWVYGYATVPWDKVKGCAIQRQQPEFFVLVHREKQDGSHQYTALAAVWLESFFLLFHVSQYKTPYNISVPPQLENMIELDYPWNKGISIYMCLAIIPQSMTAVFRIFSWRIILDRFYIDGHQFTSTM